MIFIKHWIKNFFGFSRSQVNAFIILLPLVSLVLFSEPLVHWWISSRPLDFESDRKTLDSMVAVWDIKAVEEKNGTVVPNSKLFAFNPNMAVLQDFLKLGFSQQLAGRIVNYRVKGGKFRIKSDLLKIYGVDSAFYSQIHPFITLPDRVEFPEKREKKHITKNISATEKVSEKFDLNTADTSQLKKIYGIGEKLSLRIIKYRDVLGGFVNMNQLREVYGLDSMVVNRIMKHSTIQSKFQPVKININTASEKQLYSHPYLSKVAKSIVSYRFQHGDFKTLEEIRSVGAIEEKSVQRIIPYLKLYDDL